MGGDPCVHVQGNAGFFRLLDEGGAQQIHRLVLAEAAGGEGLHVGLDLLDVLLGLLGAAGGQKAADHVQVVAHVVLVHRRLHLRLAQGVHLLLGLLQLYLQQGALHLGAGTLLALDVEGGQEQDVEHHQHRGQELVEGLNAGIQRIGVDGGGVVKNVIAAGKAPEQQQGGGGTGHGAVGRGHEVPAEQVERPAQQHDIHQIAGHGAVGQGLHGHAAPAGRLAAEIGGGGADDGDAPGLFQRQHQNQHQRQMDDQGVDLLDSQLAQRQPAQELDHQKAGAQVRDQTLLAGGIAAAGDEHIKRQPVDQHQSVIEHVQQGRDIHVGYGHSSSLSANSSFI